MTTQAEGKSSLVHVRMRRDLLERIDGKVAAEGSDRSAVIRQLLELALENERTG